MKNLNCRHDENWLAHALTAVENIGFAIVEGVLANTFLDDVRVAMYQTQAKIVRDIGQYRLTRAGELGVLRIMLKYDPIFLQLLEIPEVLQVIDNTVSNTAIMYVQNGFILPPLEPNHEPDIFQLQFHQDFGRVLNGYLCSINLLFAIDEYTVKNGATLVVPGSHQKMSSPDLDYINRHAIPIECPAGSVIIFDSTLWHAAGKNYTQNDRLAINHMFIRSYLKQQIDYVRVLGNDAISKLPERTQQLLGWYTRVPTSLEDYYKPEAERLYRASQG